LSVSSLEDYRRRARIQELVFDIARGFTKQYTAMPQCTVPAHALFPQLVEIVRRYIEEKVTVNPPGDLKDVGLSPYYGWLVEILGQPASGYQRRRSAGGAAI
jgi:type III restriction enzyme